jgi:hypothetical protein
MNRSIPRLIMISLLVLSSISCRKNDEADIIYYVIIGQQADVELSVYEFKINITFPETLTNAEDIVAGFLLSEGAVATVNGRLQVSEKTRNNYEPPFSYLVRSEDKSNIIEWKVSATNNLYTLSWGLGGFLKYTYANNKDYEWYLDQKNTGVYSYNNCGPTSTTMSAKWSNPSFPKTPQDARAAYRPAGGWWYTSDIDQYLTDNSIPHYFVNLSSTATGSQQVITTKLNEGNIIILCLDMYYIRPEASPAQRIDKFYVANTVGWGHFIVVKGYRIVDDQVYFEVYDPYCFGKTYTDGTLKGKNRYYRINDIFKATSQWWNYAIVVTKAGDVKSIKTGLDPSTIPHMWGR